MAYISVTNQFVASAVANAAQVNQNYSDIVNGLKDGTKDLQISSAIVNSKLTAKGDVVIGTDLTNSFAVNGRLSSDLVPASSSTYSLGSSTFTFKTIYADEVNTTKVVSASETPWAGSYEISTFVRSGGTNTLAGAINNTFTVNSPNSNIVSFTSVDASTQQLDFLKVGKYKLSAQFMFDAISHVTSTRNVYLDVTSSTVNFLTKIPTDNQIRMFYAPVDYPYGTLVSRDIYFECTAANQILKLNNDMSDVGSTGEWQNALGYVVTPLSFS